MNWKMLLQAAPFIAIAVLGWRLDAVQDKLTLEQSDHKETRTALDGAIEKGNGWMAAYHEALDTAQAHKKATQACLDRAVEARAAAEERSTIVQAAQPRPRTDNEQKQVVDDATRKRSADRLNRPL